MSLGIIPNLNTDQVVREIDKLRKIGARPQVPLRQIGQRVATHARRRLNSREKTFGARTGKLARSITSQVNEAYVRVGSPMVYARIQQVGGKVKPSRGKYLAIPLTAALRRRGVWPRDLPRDSLKYEPAAKIKLGNRSWTGPALVRAQSTDAEKKLVGSQGRDVKGRFASKADDVHLAIGEKLFALVKTVTIKGRPYLLFAAEEERFALQALRSYYRRQLQAQRGNN